MGCNQKEVERSKDRRLSHEDVDIMVTINDVPSTVNAIAVVIPCILSLCILVLVYTIFQFKNKEVQQSVTYYRRPVQEWVWQAHQLVGADKTGEDGDDYWGWWQQAADILKKGGDWRIACQTNIHNSSRDLDESERILGLKEQEQNSIKPRWPCTVEPLSFWLTASVPCMSRCDIFHQPTQWVSETSRGVCFNLFSTHPSNLLQCPLSNPAFASVAKHLSTSCFFLHLSHQKER